MDYRLFRTLNALSGRSGVADAVLKLLATRAILLIPLVLVALWVIPGRQSDSTRVAVVLAVAAAMLALGTNQVLNHLVHRPRPYVAHRVHLLLARTTDSSFPSDHTAFSMAVATGLAPRRRRVAALVAAMGIGIGIARIAVGVHYPGDIVGGAAVGLGSALGLWLFVQRPATALTHSGERLYGALGRLLSRKQ
jgi:undecaprenyl-diphosphatase